MARVEPEEFAAKHTARIFIAARLREAQQIERLLSERGIDYAIRMEPYQTRLLGLLPVEYQGAVFYVLSGQAAFCRQAVREAGLAAGLVEDA